MFITGTEFYIVFDPLKKIFRFWSDSGGSELKKIFQPVMVFLGGLSGLVMKVPAGVLVGGLIAGLLYKAISGVPSHNTRILSIVTQMLVAYVIVASSDISTMKTLPSIVPIAVCYSFILLGFSILLAWLCSRYLGIDLFTALFAMPPGGLSGLGLAAAELGANAPVVILFHVIRIIIVLLTVPLVARLICK